MFSHVTDLTRNLMWTRGGTVWAMWRLQAMPYGFRSDKAKDSVRTLHAALLRAVRGEALLLSFAASADPAQVVEAMIDGIDVDKHPAWAAECIATLDTLEGYDLGARGYWLAVPLANSGTNRVMEPLRSGVAMLKDNLAMARTGPSPLQVALRRRQADEIRKALPAAFKATPASVSEMVWVNLHAQQRGLYLDRPIPEPTDGIEQTDMGAPSSLPAPVIDPCATSDLGSRRPITPVDVLTRRYLKVTNPDTMASSYQVAMVLADVPNGGVAFPGGEWLGRLDECGQVVDWAQRLTIRSRDEVTSKNRRANTKLNDQAFQREGENTGGTMGGQLALAASQLAEYQSIIESDQLEVEAQATTIFAVGAASADEARDSAGEVRKHFADLEFRVVDDPSAQEALWWSMLPGAPTTKVVGEYAQITTAFNLAASVPVICPELGDRAGSLVGLEISTSRVSPVLLDIAAASLADASPACAIAGELGAGKSVLMKKLANDGVDRGGDLTAIDRTRVGEWASAVRGIDGHVIVDISERAEHSIDPLRLFPPKEAGRITMSFLSALLNVAPMSADGVLLNRVLDPAYLKAHELRDLGAVIDHLETLDGPEAAVVAGRMRVISTKDFGRAIFDSTLPVVDLTAPAIVFLTALMQLPRHEELTSGHLFRQMSLEKIFGRAVFALLASIARERCFANPARLGIFAVDEAHSVTSSPEGIEEVKIFVRDGRKHNAALLIGSHDPEADFGDEVLRGLIKCRILMRHTDETLAMRGLRWVLGQPADSEVDPDLVTMITQNTSPLVGGTVPVHRRGECMMRDFAGRIGRVKVLLPAQEERARLITTTPKAVAA
jgi:hypothetical protein